MDSFYQLLYLHQDLLIDLRIHTGRQSLLPGSGTGRGDERCWKRRMIAEAALNFDEAFAVHSSSR